MLNWKKPAVAKSGPLFVLAALVACAALPATAQEAQGPPDGFRLPEDNRPPAEGPADNGIPPIAAPTRPETRPAPAPPVIVPEAAPRPALPAAPAPRAAPPVRPPARGAAPAPANPAIVPPPPTAAPPPLPENSDSPATLPDAPDVAGPSTAPENGPAPTPDWWGQPAYWIGAALLLLLMGAGVALRRRRASIGPAEDITPVPERAPSPLPRTRAPARPVAPPPPLLPAPRIEPPPPPLPPAQGRARLTMTLQLDAMELNAEAARVSFTLLLANSGERDATGGLVRIALQQAHPQQTALIERFFDGAGGSVLAEDVDIAAGDVGSIVRHALLQLADVEPMLVGGYPSLIPVLAFDVTYHWNGEGDAFGQCAGAYVLGTSAAADGRVAPVRLDQGPRRLNGPVARVTELQRFT
jgi:hypothetical protein